MYHKTRNCFFEPIFRGSLIRFFERRNKVYTLAIDAHIKSLYSGTDINDNFIKQIRDRILWLHMPMVLVIRDIHRLDPFTHRVFMTLMCQENKQFMGLILWIIFVEFGQEEKCAQWYLNKTNENGTRTISHRVYRLLTKGRVSHTVRRAA
ncbi:MAG: hypothetical protein A2268_11270 [Candidatus Raymondbacteria bacterium RifOxyA12_full_50_37]|uniref:Uncharacterized protein n=1 Tax=Candidatus Raymondbacteria bacterium RIFOXYD12_FULL_49_13 TaxID=1817890 RepID=A0A1F7FAG7_UNCRA|nr:MAG: hypothetical protein A2268_11270 [Candidatus Raymondbacteria bacterium RifOxyA12_full_50_37]OGJ89638.1 MAG: hypothetical protein A2350_20335 [Candidatus Raymondbacteria bacterium RifOxyB12_full_50_8]OGJ92354.1 MAG: hypothetical protein A2248_10395 [Candidatus Raymondbacteria bacterium RIFOXYA2_FULL_49_16]OGJ94980.1 MAG: hypothetical protein A2487_05275 [Candidatus Raymondbacteria bacterium RifOxyC12_full_50_8]OGJ99335.1 MAG: hypothetical protein A2453_13455 [Candidatus Raymondbacteria b